MSLPSEKNTTDRPSSQARTPPPAGGAIYGLGLVGALVWFWRQADGVGGHFLGVLKAIVWPAILVHDAFKTLRG